MIGFPFEVGIVHAMAFPETLAGEGPILETARTIIEDEFFDAIEVSWVKDNDIRRQLASLLRDSAAHVVFCGGIPILRLNLDLNSLDVPTRKDAVASTRRLIDEATSIGAKTFVLCSGPDPGAAMRENAKLALTDSLREIAEYAGDEMLVSLEAFDREVDKKLLVGPTAEAVDLVVSVRKEFKNVGLTLDLSHFPLLGERASVSLVQAKDTLVHAHIGNCLPNADSHPKFGAQNSCNGVDEVREFVQTLRSIDYFDRRPAIVSFEVRPAPGESPGAVIAGSKRILMKAVRGLI